MSITPKHSEETLHKATDPSKWCSLANHLFTVAKLLWRPQNLGKEINPITQRLGDRINLVIQDLECQDLSREFWVMKSIRLPKLCGWCDRSQHPESWVKISIRSPKLWVIGLILLPKLHSRRSDITTLIRWVAGVPGSVTLCKVSSDCKILLTFKTFIIPGFTKKRPQIVYPVWTHLYIAPRCIICKSSDFCGNSWQVLELP